MNYFQRLAADLIKVATERDEATARAEAAEARVKALEEALRDIRDRKWNTLTQGCDAACEAASIARAALGEDHDK